MCVQLNVCTVKQTLSHCIHSSKHFLELRPSQCPILQHISCEWFKNRRCTWFGHCVGHGLWHFIIYELHTLTGEEANLVKGQK